jgi:hypothetical protein
VLCFGLLYHLDAKSAETPMVTVAVVNAVEPRELPEDIDSQLRHMAAPHGVALN